MAAATLTILPAGIASFTVNRDRVIGGATVQGTVTLRNPAPEGGELVTLSSDQPVVAGVPASVTIPAGMRASTFPVGTLRTNRSTSVILSASYGGVSTTTRLTVLRR